MDEVHVAALVQPGEQRGRVGELQAVPADVGQLQVGLDQLHLSGDEAQTIGLADLAAPVEQQLHPQADAQHGLLGGLLLQGGHQAGLL